MRIDSITVIVPGAPRTKKNRGKIWKRGSRTVIRPAEPWLRWRDAVAGEGVLVNGKRHWGVSPTLLPTGDWNAAAHFYRDRAAGDAVGYYQGVADVLEELGVVANDRQLVSWDGSRLFVDRANPRVELTLTPATMGLQET